MSELLTVEHVDMTVGELTRTIEHRADPVIRSVHMGNIRMRNLFILTALPPGVEVLAVDTVQALDSHSRPDRVILDGSDSPLCSRKEAKGKIVGSVRISKIGEEKEDKDKRLDELVVIPCIGETLSTFHARAIKALDPNNLPVIMSQYFGRQPDLLQAAILSSLLVGEVQRAAQPDGKVVAVENSQANSLGVYGINDLTSKEEGLLPSLVTIMALDIAMSALLHRAQKTIHLAGSDMMDYTRDPGRMERVGLLLAKIACELGLRLDEHTYQIVDITGLDRLVSTATHASQHQLLRAGDAVSIDLERHANKPCGSNALTIA